MRTDGDGLFEAIKRAFDRAEKAEAERDSLTAALEAAHEEIRKIPERETEKFAAMKSEIAKMLDHNKKIMDANAVLEAERDALRKELEAAQKELRLEKDRIDWLDWHCSFVASEPYRIGPYKEGQLRTMADDGIEQRKGFEPSPEERHEL